ncbi:MAG: hypothetical protein ISQ90_06710 [Rhodospirillales bacterium]|nr:hypothetical protein [Rhodospirillales bacterium]
MSFWVISYHINFHMDDGNTITRNDMRTTEDPKVNNEKKAKKWLLDRYHNSNDPMVDMSNLFVGVKSEEIIIDEIIQNNESFE